MRSPSSSIRSSPRSPGSPFPFQNSVVPVDSSARLRHRGQPDFSQRAKHRREARTRSWTCSAIRTTLNALTPGHQVQLLIDLPASRRIFAMATSAATRRGSITISATSKPAPLMSPRPAFICRSVYSPNSYGGADPAFAPFTQFDSAGQAHRRLGPESVLSPAIRTPPITRCKSALARIRRAPGSGLQASYTYSKSLDDTSSVLGRLDRGRRRGAADLAAESMESRRGKRSVHLRCDSRLHRRAVIQLLPLDHVELSAAAGQER